ncbi:MAG: M24 family metallopeptidase [Candidatus Hydrothermarchaeales archaeon]
MRVERAMDLLFGDDLDCGIILKPENIYYLTGFFPTTFSALLLKSEPLLLVSKMDAVSIGGCPVEVKVVEKFEGEFERLRGRIGVEKRYTTMHFYERHLRGKDISDLKFIEEMRMVKDREELEKMSKAITIAEAAMKGVSSDLVGRSEIEVAAEAEDALRGEAKPAFDTVVASGKNSSIPHHEPTKKKIEPGDSVIIDMGAKWERYNSDITRTFCSNSSEEFLELYDAVRDAQRAGIREIRGGNEIGNVDIAVRKVLEEYDLDEHFIHSSGHGIGIEVHEAPKIGKESEGVFREGMVVTIEPGVYKGVGVRIEDMVLVKKKAEVLTKI